MGKQSLICPISTDKKDVERILNEAGSFAEYLGLSEDAANQMRLMTEEMLGLTEVIIGSESGTFWIEESETGYKIHSEIKGDIFESSNAMLVNAATDGKNKAYKGIMGKFREIYDILIRSGENTPAMTYDSALAGGNISYGFSGDFAEWTLEKYRKEAAREEIINAWDGMENLILTKFADNIIVSVRNKKAEITIEVKL